MTTFASIDIYPAIDLRHGQVVRLQLGDPDRQTTFSDDPLTVAKKWVDNGANWLHVVNLDGAFDEAGLSNWQVLSRLTGIGSHVQFGGGLRTLKDIARALNFGVSRVILGTMAVEEPDVVADAVRHFGAERIAVGIDAKEGKADGNRQEYGNGAFCQDTKGSKHECPVYMPFVASIIKPVNMQQGQGQEKIKQSFRGGCSGDKGDQK